MKNRYSKLLGNSFIFAIANLGTKLMQFIMVPLYTYVLSKSDFGAVDLVSTTLAMLAPIISLSISDAVFRFAMDSESNNKVVLTNGLLITSIGSIIVLILIPVGNLLDIPFVSYGAIMLIMNLFISLCQNFARSVGFVKIFAFSGLLSAFSVAGLNIILLLIFRFGVRGYLISIIASSVIVMIYMIIRMKIWNYLSIKYIDIEETKKMLRYSVPLIPNAFSWWFTNDANKYFILIFVGASGNGLYALATKVPSIMSMIFNIFNQAWQMSAVEEFDSYDRGKFYSQILNFIIVISLLGMAGILVILKPFMAVYASQSFYESWKLVPFLLVAACYSNISAFYGTIFIAQKKTRAIMSTTIYGMITNLLVNLLLIPSIGVNGAGVGSSLGFLCVWLFRARLVKKVMDIKLNIKKIIFGHGLIAVMIMMEYLETGIQLIIIEFALSILICLLFKAEIMQVAKFVGNLKVNRRKK